MHHLPWLREFLIEYYQTDQEEIQDVWSEYLLIDQKLAKQHLKVYFHKLLRNYTTELHQSSSLMMQSIYEFLLNSGVGNEMFNDLTTANNGGGDEGDVDDDDNDEEEEGSEEEEDGDDDYDDEVDEEEDEVDEENDDSDNSNNE